MKSRRLLSGVMVVALLLGAVRVSVRAQDDGETPGVPVLGAINIIEPDLLVTPATGGEETRLVANSVFNPGETLRTDASGVGLITWFYDGTETVLAPETRVTLNSFSGDATGDYAIDMELHEGHLVGGMGDVATELSEGGEWTIKTPDFTAHPLRGQFELTVSPDRQTRLIVTEGRVEVLVGDAPPFPVDANQYLVGAPGVTENITTDGLTPSTSLIQSGICTATAPVNINLRLAPNEDSRRLAGIAEGQTLWVRAATEGELWLQVYFETSGDDVDANNYGWVYGPAVELDDADCDGLLRAPLDAIIYGGFGIDEALGSEGETEPVATEEAAE